VNRKYDRAMARRVINEMSCACDLKGFNRGIGFSNLLTRGSVLTEMVSNGV
jgi:hypothetical protein